MRVKILQQVRCRNGGALRTSRFARQPMARKWTCAQSARQISAHKSIYSTSDVQKADLCATNSVNRIAQVALLDISWLVNGLVRNLRGGTFRTSRFARHRLAHKWTCAKFLLQCFAQLPCWRRVYRQFARHRFQSRINGYATSTFGPRRSNSSRRKATFFAICSWVGRRYLRFRALQSVCTTKSNSVKLKT